MSNSRRMDKRAVVLMKWMNLEPILQSEVSQKEKHQYTILMYIYMEFRMMVTITIRSTSRLYIVTMLI